MKKIYSIVAFAMAALCLTSCSDFLDQKSESEQSTETTYESPYYTGLVVNKIYGLMSRDYTYSQVIPIIWGANTDTELIDGLGTAVETASERGVMNYRMSETFWARIGDWWKDYYDIIEYCNLVISGVRNSELYKSGSASDKKAMGQYLGEALTLRAMMYLDIIRMWGNVPMKFEPTQPDLSNAYLGKTDRDVIMDQLLTQLEEAIELLPWADAATNYTTERVTKGYAKALYAQIALTRAGYAIREDQESKTKQAEGYEKAPYSDDVFMTLRPSQSVREGLYKKAAVQLADIINSGRHALNPSYKDEWYQLNQLVLDKAYRENIFEVPNLHNVTGELGYTVGKRMNGITTDWGYGNSSGKLKTTATLWYSYDPADTRRDITCAVTQYQQDGENTAEKFIGNAPFGIYIGKWRPEWMSEAWLSQNKAASAKHMTGINTVRMRYAQVLLYYAECLNEIVGPDATLADAGTSKTARQALAEVHKRAFEDKSAAQTYVDNLASDKDGFREAIMQENAWELTGEGFRKFDLIRWGVLAQKIANMKKDYNEKCTTWDQYVHYKASATNPNYVDMSSCVFDSEKEKADYQTATWFGFADDTKKEGNTQWSTNLPRISEGLVGTTIDGTIGTPVNIAKQAVKNRYILPFTTKMIADANGALVNSYGY